MPYLIDTYNLIHQCHLLPTEQTIHTAIDLAELLSRLIPDEEIRLICDGAPTGSLPERHMMNQVEIRFAGGGRDADSLMEWILQTDHATRELTVISSDRRLIKAAKRAKAKHLTSEAFTSQLTRLMHQSTSDVPDHSQGWEDKNIQETMTQLSHDMDLSDMDLSQLDKLLPDLENKKEEPAQTTTPIRKKPSPTPSPQSTQPKDDALPDWLDDFDPDEINLDELENQLPAHMKDQIKSLDQQQEKQRQLNQKKKEIQEEKEKVVEQRPTSNPLLDEFTKDLPPDDQKTLSEETDTDRWLKNMGIDPNRMIDEHGA